jgi:hypothetical protein
MVHSGFAAFGLWLALNAAAYFESESLFVSGVMFELGGALLAVPLTVWLIDELLRRRESGAATARAHSFRAIIWQT